MFQGTEYFCAFSVDMLWGKFFSHQLQQILMMNDSYLTQVWSFPLTFFEVIDCEDQWRGENPQQTETGKGVLKICSKFTGEHPCESAISIMFLCSLTEIALQYGCSPVNLLHIFRTLFSKSTSGWLLHSKQLPVLILKSPQVS